MHIQAWQQFSSNHSAHFTIVGELPTLEEAQRIGAEMRAVLTEIVEWYDRPENASYKTEVMNTGSNANWTTNPIEDEIGQRYDVDLETATDWLMAHEGELERALTVSGRYVILETHGTGEEFMPMNFDKLMSKMGANAKEYHTLVTLVCDAPDIPTARRIQDAVNKHLFFAKYVLFYRRHFSYPWIVFRENRPLLADPETQILLAEFGKIVDVEYQLVVSWYAIHYPHEYGLARETQDWTHLRSLNSEEYIEILNEYLIPEDLLTRVEKHRWHEHYGFSLLWRFKEDTKIKRDKTYLQLENLSFDYVGQSLLAMIDWLESLNCTNISFTLHDANELLKGNEPSG